MPLNDADELRLNYGGINLAKSTFEGTKDMNEACNCSAIDPAIEVEYDVLRPAFINGEAVEESNIQLDLSGITPQAVSETDSRIEFTLLLNGVEYTDSPSFVFSSGLIAAGDCEEVAFKAFIPYRRLGECPDIIEIQVVSTLPDGTICIRKVLRYKEYKIFKGRPNEACGEPVGPF